MTRLYPSALDYRLVHLPYYRGGSLLVSHHPHLKIAQGNLTLIGTKKGSKTRGSSAGAHFPYISTFFYKKFLRFFHGNTCQFSLADDKMNSH